MTEQTDAKVRMHAADLEAAGDFAEARQVASDALRHLAATVDPTHPAVATATRIEQAPRSV